MQSKKAILMVMMLAIAPCMLLLVNSVNAQTLVWFGSVSSSGATIEGPVLINGANYLIVAAISDWWYDAPANLQADAQYYTTNPIAVDWTNHFPAPDGHSFLQINDMDVDWGAFSNGDTGHTYSITYVGEGMAVNFRIVDWMDGNYANNNCHIPVSIYLIGLTPGFWKHNVGVYLTAQGYDHVKVKGDYSDPAGSPTVTRDNMATFLGTFDIDDLYNLWLDMRLKGHGAAGNIIRVDAANVFNEAAGLPDFPY